jgi:hypothetical protein
VSDTNELDRLRVDLEVLKRYNEAGEGVLDRAVAIARDRIISLEAEADPWADAKRVANHWLHQPPTPDAGWVARLVLHLEADNAKLKAEIDTLKAEPHADENGHIVFPDKKAEANPWREAQDWVLAEFVHLGGPAPVALYVQHLEADNAALREEVRLSHIERDEHAAAVKARDRGIEQQKARIAQLESGEKSDSLVIRGLRMKIAELEARPVPPLDPKRVIATACKVIAKKTPFFASVIMQGYQAGDAGIYPLAGNEPT